MAQYWQDRQIDRYTSWCDDIAIDSCDDNLPCPVSSGTAKPVPPTVHIVYSLWVKVIRGSLAQFMIFQCFSMSSLCFYPFEISQL